MLTARKDGREIRAMVLSEPVDRCRGVVQCALAGCEASMPIFDEDGSVSDQVAWFLEQHECHATVAIDPAKESSS